MNKEKLKEISKNLKLKHLIWFIPLWSLLIITYVMFSNYLNYKSVSPEGGPDPITMTLPFMPIWLIGGCASPILGLLFIFNKKKRWISIYFLVAFFVFWIILITFNDHKNYRDDAFQKLGERFTPLIEAIEAYNKDNGYYPKKLDDLIPKYLKELPSTQMGNYPTYEYFVGEKAKEYNNNPWVIVMNVGWGIETNSFMYFPLQNYPETGYDGALQRLGKWVFVYR